MDKETRLQILRDEVAGLRSERDEAYKTITRQAERIAELELVANLIDEKYNELQDDYAKISMDMTGDEKQVTDAKSRNVQVKFALAMSDILCPAAVRARKSLGENNE